MNAPLRCDVLIVGSGFAGSVLARVLRAGGVDVILVERGRHPRFALGESTTPLANLVLERLAARHRLADLHQLAAWGRWKASPHPEVTVGLKRGFTFYRHQAGEPYRAGAANEARLLVAASPNDAIADTHWLRADVDAFLVDRACEEGVRYLDDTTLDGLDRDDGGWTARGERRGDRLSIRAGAIVDGSGAGGFLARALAIADETATMRTASGLAFGHVRDLPLLETLAGGGWEPGPYPDERAAVHHLVDAGWMYVLRFDDGRASVGLLAEGADLDAAAARAAWDGALARHPSLAALYDGALWVRPLAAVPRIQRRLARAAGERWFLLPHSFAFVDPLFSTGIAWSLLAVERLAEILLGSAEAGAYDRLLRREADRIDDVVAAAYAARHDFRAFAAVSWLYFTAVSWSEVRQRLLAAPAAGGSWAWQGFLGVGDPELDAALVGIDRRVRGALAGGDVTGLVAWAGRAIEARDLGGFADLARRNLHPVDLELLVERAGLLGLSRQEVVAALPRLRGVRP